MTKPLSPAAQAVVDAWNAKLNPDPDGLTYLTHDPEREALAAALRAAVDQVYEVPACIRGDDYWNYRNGVEAERSRILAIAAELEGADG